MYETNTMKNIAFLGAGNMASALITGLLSQQIDPSSIYATGKDHSKLALLEQQGINTSTDNLWTVQHAKLIVLCVKPQHVRALCQEISGSIPEDALIISVAAGIRLRSLSQWLGRTTRLVRAMPNTPFSVSAGACGLFGSTDVMEDNAASEVLRAQVIKVFSGGGIAEFVSEEAQIDAITALSGSGPAYIFRICEALVKSATDQGLSPDIALAFAKQTCFGAGKLLVESTASPEALRQQVTSPGGTTQAALSVLDNQQLGDIFSQAMLAAEHRAAELADLAETA